MKKIMNKRLIAIGLLLCCSMAHAETYKWTDTNGEVVYGQFPPKDVKAELVKSPAKASSSAKEEIKAFEDQKQAELDQSKKLEEDQKIQDQKLEKMNIWKANCQTSKNKLTSLKEKPKVRKTDAFGQLSVMPEDELQAKISQAEKDVEIFCKPPKEGMDN